jgi:hypothetical protein
MKIANLWQAKLAIKQKPASSAKFKMTISANAFNGASAKQAVENIQNMAHQQSINCFVDTEIKGIFGLSTDYKIVLDGNAKDMIPVLEYIERCDDV